MTAGAIESLYSRLKGHDVLIEAARYLPLESLALSPQCGFASMMEGNLMNEEQQWAKLKLVVDTVRNVWN